MTFVPPTNIDAPKPRHGLKTALAFTPLLAMAALLMVLGYYNFHKKSEFEPREIIGHIVPNLPVASLRNSEPTSLIDLAKKYNKPILINVFASWCTPCLAENPHLLELKKSGVVIIGIAYKDTPVKAISFLTNNGDPYTEVLNDDEGRLGLELGISGVPETFVVTPDGKISEKLSGPMSDHNQTPLLTALKN